MKTAIKILMVIFGLILLLFVGLLVIILTTPSPAPAQADTVAEVDIYETAEADIYYEETEAAPGDIASPEATLNGSPISFHGPAPVVIDDYNTLFPLRAVFTALGFNVFWDGDARINIVSGRDKIIVIPIDDNVFYIDGESFGMDLSTRIIDGSTMIPLTIFRYIGYDISWDAVTNTLAIISFDINDEEVAE